MHLVTKFCALSSSLFSHNYHINGAISSRDGTCKINLIFPALTFTIKAREDACQNAPKDVEF